MSTKFKPNPHFKPKPHNFTIRYPDIMIKHDDKAADMFFSYVISGDVNSLDSFIIQNSIPINIRNNDGQSALHLSVTSDLPISSKLNMIKFLLMNYIPVNEKDNNGNTSLLLASKRAEEDVIELLMEYGADPNIGNTFKIKPLHYVSSGNLHNCEDVVIDSIIEKPTPQTYDKMEINELTKSVKDFYNDTLVNFGNLQNTELSGNTKPYNKRISAFLKHNKYIAENIKNEDINKKIEDLKKSTLKKYMDKIKDKRTNPNEIKNKLIEVRKEYVDEYVDIIKKVDKRIFEPIDLQPVDHIDDDGLVIANYLHAIELNGGPKLWKIHGEPTLNQTLQKSYMQIFQDIPQHLDEIKKNTDIYIDIIRGNETSIDGLKNQIIHSGKQIQKLELLDNIMRLIKMGSDLKYYDFQKIDTNPRGANNILLNEALKNLFQTDTNINNNFGLKPLNQAINNNMASYHVMSRASVPANLDLQTFTVGANNNRYDNDLLKTIKYNDDPVFSNPIEINFPTPVTIQLSNNLLVQNNFFQKSNGDDWTFNPSNSVNNVIKITLEYKSLTQVKLTATYNFFIEKNLANPPLPPPLPPHLPPHLPPPIIAKSHIIQQFISTEYYSNLKITYISSSNNINLNEPWNYTGIINVLENMLETHVSGNISALPHDNPNCITLSLPDTGGPRVYATEHLYLPLYAFHQSILTGNTNYKTIIENRINDINYAVDNCIIGNLISLTDYDDVFTGLRDLIIEIYQYQVRYRNILELYGDEQIKVRLQKLEDIKRVLHNYESIDKVLHDEMIEDIDLLNWDYGKMVTNIDGNLENIIDNINNLIENVNNISLINTINHYWNIQNDKFNVNRLIRHRNVLPQQPGLFYKIENIDLEEDHKRFNYVSDDDLDYHLRYNKHYTGIIYNNNPLDANLQISDNINNVIGINFSPQPGNEHTFVEPTYDIVNSSIIPNYFTLVRYRMLEEILLYIYYKKDHGGAEKTIYDKINDYVKENIGNMLEQYRIPMVLSILGDTIDNLLINNLKKEIRDIANNDFLEFMDENLSGITLGTSTVNARGKYTELDLKTISFDDAFELNLGEIDSNVIDAIKKKVIGLNYDEIQILNKGDKLIMEPEYKNIDYNALDPKDQQIYYSTGFLDNSSKNLCIKYNNNIMTKIIDSGVGLDDTDLYGNTPLFYAIKTNNYLAVKTLLNKNARSLYKNDQNMTPLHYALHKLEQICDYFPGKNLITSINKSYNIGIKEELLKINSSRNLMKNYDKIVELYLFMYNSNAFSNIYAKNYNILKKFIEMISDQLKGTYQDKHGNDKYPLLLANPLFNYTSNINKPNIQRGQMSVLINNKRLIEKEINKLKEDRNKLMNENSKLQEYRDLLNDQIATNYGKNVMDQIIDANASIDVINTKLAESRKLITDIENGIETTARDNKVNSRDDNTSKSINDLINQNILVSQLFDDDEVSHNDSKPYLNAVHKMLKSNTHGMSTYNVHSHINLQIKEKIKELLEYLGKSYYDVTTFNVHKSKFIDLKDVFFNILSSRIFMKNSKSTEIGKNTEKAEDYEMICFTIDQIVGYSFYKVLSRIVMTYLSKIIPRGEGEEEDKYMQYIGEKTKTIMNLSGAGKLSVKKIVLPDYENLDDKDSFKYEPSYLTKRMVTTIGNFKSAEQYSEQDNSASFELISNLILNNNVIPIDDKSQLSEYLDDIIIPYFQSYYTIAVKTLSNLTLNYENMIQNQYVLLKIIIKLLETITKPEFNDYQIQNIQNLFN